MKKTRCLILGSGPAGFTAAIYAGRAGLSPLLYEGIQPGGQLTITTDIENFPGYPEGVSGTAMMDDLRRQALRFGVEVCAGAIADIDTSSRPFRCTDSNGETIEAATVIVATGASARWLGIESEKKYYGQGVSACATCDGYFYKNQPVLVVGGGDTACEEANYLATICSKVYLVHRRDELRASKAMQQRVLSNPKIEMVWDSRVHEIVGSVIDGVTGVDIANVKSGAISHVDVSGVFIAIGHSPNTSLFEGKLQLDGQGYIVVKPGTSLTSVEGIFAAGDVCDPSYRQAIVAAAGGCKAAMDAERFLQQA
ncbi:MAG: thioredoxin-disulfide reductase [Bacteroidales bacterium]|nr:thioredoxin-disulfide reductase [Bacteroidales bacterium]